MLRRLLATTSLLILASTDQEVDDDLCKPYLQLALGRGSEVVTALQGVGGALQCFKNIFQESLQYSKDSDANLIQLVLELRSEMKNLKKSDDCDVLEVKKLAEENSDLKLQLSDKDEKVQDLERKLNTSLKQVEEIEQKLKLHNCSAGPSISKIKGCEAANQPDIRQQVEEYSWSNDWKALRTGLEAALSNSSTAYKQMQRVPCDEKHALWTIGRSGYSRLATLLVCAGLPPDASDADGDSMLHAAARGGQVATASTLLDLGADVEARGSAGRTPLMWAAASDQLNAAKLLVARGAALAASTGDGDTALHFAAREGHLVMVRYLVEAGAPTAAPGRDGYTALDVANINAYTAMTKYLTEYPH